jgi:hypothetical protein
MRHSDTKIESVANLITELEKHIDPKKPIWFRGQSSSKWGLQPSLARDPKTITAEAALMKRFKQNAMPHLSKRPASEWEWLFLMQHYRLPTRLLDWTESPLTALYFAVSGNSTGEAALWCLDPVALNAHANIRFGFSVEVPAFDHDSVLDSYLPSRIASETTSELNPIAAIAQRNSPRISAQLGTFTITHRTHTKIEDIAGANHVWRYLVPAAKRKRILRELSHLRITQLALFPDLDSVAIEAKESMK